MGNVLSTLLQQRCKYKEPDIDSGGQIANGIPSVPITAAANDIRAHWVKVTTLGSFLLLRQAQRDQLHRHMFHCRDESGHRPGRHRNHDEQSGWKACGQKKGGEEGDEGHHDERCRGGKSVVAIAAVAAVLLIC